MENWVIEDPLIGKMIGGKYKVLEPIGQGAMGSVYLAEHVELKKMVALKILRQEHSARADIVARFQEEGRALARLKSDHVVEVYDLGQDVQPGINVCYMAMELLEGRSLEKEIEEVRVIDSSRAALIVYQALTGLADAHASKIIHRDIKPANMILTEMKDGTLRVQLVDFGLAKSLSMPGKGLTATGDKLGTPYYMAPEQILPDSSEGQTMYGPIGPGTDIYAMGTVLFECLTGRPPFDVLSDTTVAQFRIMDMHLKNPVPAMTVSDEPVPEKLQAVVRKAMAKKPKDRFQSVNEMRAALETAVGRPLSTMPLLKAPSAPSTSTGLAQPNEETEILEPNDPRVRKARKNVNIGAAETVDMPLPKTDGGLGFLGKVVLLAFIGVLLASGIAVLAFRHTPTTTTTVASSTADADPVQADVPLAQPPVVPQSQVPPQPPRPVQADVGPSQPLPVVSPPQPPRPVIRRQPPRRPPCGTRDRRGNLIPCF